MTSLGRIYDRLHGTGAETKTVGKLSDVHLQASPSGSKFILQSFHGPQSPGKQTVGALPVPLQITPHPEHWEE